MNCYEWAAGVDIRCSVETDISHGIEVLLINATATSANPKNKLASELTRKQLICKEITEPNIFLRQGVGCFDRWQFDGNLQFENTYSAYLRETWGEDVTNYDGLFSIYLQVYRIIYRPDGSDERVPVVPIFSAMPPWDSGDPYYNIGHRYWSRNDYEMALSGMIAFSPYTDPDTGDTRYPPVENLVFFTMDRVAFKLGVTNFNLKALSPFSNIIETVGNATLDLSIQ